MNTVSTYGKQGTSFCRPIGVIPPNESGQCPDHGGGEQTNGYKLNAGAVERNNGKYHDTFIPGIFWGLMTLLRGSLTLARQGEMVELNCPGCPRWSWSCARRCTTTLLASQTFTIFRKRRRRRTSYISCFPTRSHHYTAFLKSDCGNRHRM